MSEFNMQSISSTVAGVSVKPLRERLEHAKSGWVLTALTAAALIVPLVAGAFGFGVSFGIDRYKNGLIADRQKEILADHYKNQIAITLGVNPQKVSLNDLELAAQVNPMVRCAIDKVEEERNSANRSALMGMAGATAMGAAAGGLGLLPGGAGIAYGAAKLAVDGVGMVAGTKVSDLFDKDILQAQDVIEHLDAKKHAGQPIDSRDVLMMRIAQSEALQADIKKYHAKGFHKMNDAEQQMVIASLPPQIYNEAVQAAEKIASGQMTVEQLLMPVAIPANENHAPKGFVARELEREQARKASASAAAPANENAPTGWAAREQKKTASFVEAVNDRAAASAQPQVG